MSWAFLGEAVEMQRRDKSRLELAAREFLGDFFEFLRWNGFLPRTSITGRPAMTFRKWNWAQATFAQHGEDLLLERIFYKILGYQLRENYFYVDCGAYHPFVYSMTARLSSLGWRGIAIDFSRTSRDSFARYRKDAEFILAPAGDGSNIQIVQGFLRKVGDASITSSAAPIGNESDIDPSVLVESVRISDILDQRNIQQVDFLNLDIEGSELATLKGLDFARHSPRVICVEIHGVIHTADAQSRPEVSLLLSQGYLLVASTVINFFFVRKDLIPGSKPS